MASVSKPGGVASDRAGVGSDRGGVTTDRGGVGSDVPKGTTLYDPRKSYSAGEVIWHAGWEAEGTVTDFDSSPRLIDFRDHRKVAGSEAKPAMMDVSFASSVGVDKRPSVKKLICNIPVADFHIPPQTQPKLVGGVAADPSRTSSSRGGVASD